MLRLARWRARRWCSIPAILTAIFRDTRLAPYSAWIGVTILFWITGAFLDMVRGGQ